MALLGQHGAFAGGQWTHTVLPGEQIALQIYVGILARQVIELRAQCALILLVPLQYAPVVSTNVYI